MLPSIASAQADKVCWRAGDSLQTRPDSVRSLRSRDLRQEVFAADGCAVSSAAMLLIEITLFQHSLRDLLSAHDTDADGSSGDRPKFRKAASRPVFLV